MIITEQYILQNWKHIHFVEYDEYKNPYLIRKIYKCYKMNNNYKLFYTKYDLISNKTLNQQLFMDVFLYFFNVYCTAEVVFNFDFKLNLL